MRYSFIILFVLYSCFCFGQKKKQGLKGGHSLGSIFAQQDRAHAKYFVGMGYGVGKAWWQSSLGSTEIYDKNGGVIRSGDMRFKAKNPTNSFALEGSVPVAKVRLGLGISFDYYYLDKLEILQPTGSVFILYDESFRFDKFYAEVEVPFNYESNRIWSLNATAHIGYFGFSYVDHFNLFGEEAIAKTFLGAVGLTGDIKLYPHTYLFITPLAEYKLYDNNRSENPQQIHHNIYSLSIMGGLRIDVSRER